MVWCNPVADLLRLFTAAEMQQHYVHSVLKKNESQTPPKTERDLAACRRVVLIFRHGDFVDIKKDSGCFIESLEPPDCSLVYVFGDLPDLCRDKLYSRAELLQMKAHRADRRGVSGNIHVGVDAIIVKNINIENGEADNGNQIFYYANSKLGGASLFYSYVKKQPLSGCFAVLEGSRSIAQNGPKKCQCRFINMVGYFWLYKYGPTPRRLTRC